MPKSPSQPASTHSESPRPGISCLVALHIPKTAGTSLRSILQSVCGKESIYWYGAGGSGLPLAFNEQEVAGFPILGGHRPLQFYPRSESTLFCATLRDPVARVRSLFSYYTRPGEAASEEGRAIRQKQLETWLDAGIRPESLVASLQHCEPFRGEVQNLQCAYLSREKRDFAAVLASLEQENIVVGTSEGFNALVQFLAEALQWPEAPDIKGNVSRIEGDDDILSEPGAIELIEELCAEDRKLYDYVQNEHGGLYCAGSRESLANSSLLYSRATDREVSRLAWGKVEVRTATAQSRLPRDLTSTVEIEIKNHSRERLRHMKKRNIFIAYRLLDSQGNVIACQCPRTRLDTDIPPGASHTQVVNFSIPREQLEHVSAVKVGLLYQGKFWVDTISETHAQIIELMTATDNSGLVGSPGKSQP